MTSTPPDRETRTIAAVCYLLGAVTGVACLFLYGDRPYVRFHAWQSVLLTAFFAASVAALDAVPLLGLALVFFLSAGAGLLVLLLIASAWRGRWLMLPLLGDVALELVQRRER